MIELEQALELICGQQISLGETEKDISSAQGYILAEDIFADRDYPPFDRATMDGYALLSAGYQAGQAYHLAGAIAAGERAGHSLSAGECLKIMTGAPVPPGIDAVIPYENALEQNGQVVFSEKSLSAFANIARQGEDLKQGQKVFSRGSLIGPHMFSTLSSLGKSRLRVYEPPSLALFSTGNELVAVHEQPQPWQIRDANSWTLKSFFQQFHLQPSLEQKLPDEAEATHLALQAGLHYDVCIISGGISGGEADHVEAALLSWGVKRLFHKVRIKPGKPIWAGVYLRPDQKNCLVLALPGNPLAVLAATRLFLEPWLRQRSGMPPLKQLRLPLASGRKKQGNRRDFFPVSIETPAEGVSRLQIVPFNGSGDIHAAALSDGLAVQPADVQELPAGTLVDFIPWRAL